jgi:hypothetical protein
MKRISFGWDIGQRGLVHRQSGIPLEIFRKGRRPYKDYPSQGDEAASLDDFGLCDHSVDFPRRFLGMFKCVF